MKLTKKLLAMALAGVMLLTILTGCSGGKTGDRLVEEYMAAYFHGFDAYKDIPITHDVPEIKTVASMFKASKTSWLKDDGSWAISSKASPADPTYKALQDVFIKYNDNYSVYLYAFEVDSKQNELNQAMRVMSATTTAEGLPIHKRSTTSSTSAQPTAAKCATRLVTRGDKSYRIAVIIYDHHAVAVG